MKSEGQQTRQQQQIQQQQERSASADDKNVMPSMVVRQQRIQMLSSSAMNSQSSTSTRADAHSTANLHRRGLADGVSLSTTAIPTNTSSTTASLIKAAKEQLSNNQNQQQLEFDQDGLVLPKRVLHHHPASSMAQPIIRDLNRELKFNQVRGKNVLDQKSELKKALEKLEVNKRKKEAEQERLNRRTSLELRLEERAERIAKETSSTTTTAPVATTTSTATPAAAVVTTTATTTTTTTNNNNNNSLQMSSNTCNQNPLSTFSIKSMTR